MIKRITKLIVVGMTFMILFSPCNICRAIQQAKEIKYNGYVYINGEDRNILALFTATDGTLEITLPLVRILSELGVSVEWRSNDEAVLKYASQEYVLNMKQISLIPKIGKGFNLLLLPPGSKKGLSIVENDILISYGQFIYVANQMGVVIEKVDLNAEQNYINLLIY